MTDKQKDEIILTVKNAIAANSVCSVGEEDIISLDSNDVDHIAQETADNLNKAGYRKIDENCAVITKAELKEFAEKVKSLYMQYEEVCLQMLCEDIDELLKEYE